MGGTTIEGRNEQGGTDGRANPTGGNFYNKQKVEKSTNAERREGLAFDLRVMENKRGREGTDRGAGRRSEEKRLSHGITNGR
jgi:hypothetical protein